MSDHEQSEGEFSLKILFIPFTTSKAIHWIIVIGLVIFANMLFNGFVWDDNEYILNQQILQHFNVSAFFGNNIFNNSGQYRPLTVAYYSVLYFLFKNTLFFYHFAQITLHLTNAVLLFMLFIKFFSKKLSFFLSLIFLIHPIQVESVSYISATDSPLFSLLGIAALLIGVYGKLSKRKMILQNLLIFSAALVKETGMLFFPLLLLYQFIFKKKYVLLNVIFGIISVITYFYMRNIIGGVSLINRPLIPIARLTFSERLLNIPAVIFYYLKTFFYPVTLGINQQWIITKISVSNFYLPLLFDCLFLIILLLFGYGIYKKNSKTFHIYLFFFVWFLLGLGLHSQIIALDMTVADRWAYFSLAGLLGVIGVIVQNYVLPLKQYQNNLVISFAIVIIVLLATRTIIRNIDWQNPIMLWKQAITVDDNFLSEDQLSLAYVYEGKWNDAIIPAQKSVLLFPNDNNLYNLGYIYEQTGNIQKAIQEYTLAYQAKNYIPWQHYHYLNVYGRLSILLIKTNQFHAAKKVLSSGLKDYTNNLTLWYLMTICEYKLGDRKGAINAAQQATLLAPNDIRLENLYQGLVSNQAIQVEL